MFLGVADVDWPVDCRKAYAVLRDHTDNRNHTIYEFDLAAFAKPPKAVGKIDPALLPLTSGKGTISVSIVQLRVIP